MSTPDQVTISIINSTLITLDDLIFQNAKKQTKINIHMCLFQYHCQNILPKNMSASSDDFTILIQDPPRDPLGQHKGCPKKNDAAQTKKL